LEDTDHFATMRSRRLKIDIEPSEGTLEVPVEGGKWGPQVEIEFTLKWDAGAERDSTLDPDQGKVTARSCWAR